MSTVYCHVCDFPDSEIPHEEAILIGTRTYGGLWHCRKHADCTKCPHGDYCTGHSHIRDIEKSTRHYEVVPGTFEEHFEFPVTDPRRFTIKLRRVE